MMDVSDYGMVEELMDDVMVEVLKKVDTREMSGEMVSDKKIPRVFDVEDPIIDSFPIVQFKLFRIHIRHYGFFMM